MLQFQENARTEGQAEGRKDGHTLLYRTLSTTAEGPIMVYIFVSCTWSNE